MTPAEHLRALLGTRHALIQAPMAGVQDAQLAIAACHAGALGSLPAAAVSPEVLTAQTDALRQATDAPFNLNFFCHDMPAPDVVDERTWHAALAPYYTESALDSAAIPSGAGRRPFDEAGLALVESVRPRVVSFHFGLPAPPLLERVRATGACVLSSATTLDEALWLEQQGVDAVIAQGLEAGGHRGMFRASLDEQVGTLALVRELATRLRVPVIAAGGIGDAAGVRAALALGAAGVQIGTALLRCPEATTSTIHRRELDRAAATGTAVTHLFSGRPARGLWNRLMRDLGPLNPAAPAFPYAVAALAPLRETAEAAGRGDFSPLWCGQYVAPNGARPAADIIAELAAAL